MILSKCKIFLLFLLPLILCAWTATHRPPAGSQPPAAALLHFDGEGDSQIINDSSFNWLACTVLGNTSLTTSEVVFGSTSCYLDGNGDYFYYNNQAGFIFGTGDFTIDFWVKFKTITVSPIIYEGRPADAGYSPCIYLVYPSNVFRYYVNAGVRIEGTTVATTGQWYHVAVTRASGVTRMFINGHQEGSNYTDTNNYVAGTNRPLIGRYWNGTANNLCGYLDELRVIKGYAAWTSDFSVPTSSYAATSSSHPFKIGFRGSGTSKFSVDTNTNGNPRNILANTILHGEGTPNTQVITNSGTTNNWHANSAIVHLTTSGYMFGSSSIYFPGTTGGFGDSIDSNNNSGSYAPGYRDFTIDMWFCTQWTNVTQTLWDMRYNSTAGYPFLQISSANRIIYGFNGTHITGTTVISPSVWYHVAIVKSCVNGVSMYVNGQLQGTYNDSALSYVTSGSGTPNIGKSTQGTPQAQFKGWVDEVRYVNGVAVWNKNFTPPTKPY